MNHLYIEKIDYACEDFYKIMKEAPTDIITFNRKANYYCLRIDDEIVSICGVLNYQKKHKIVSAFTYERERNKGYFGILLQYIINFCDKDFIITHANENSYKIFKKFGFKETSFKQYKKFTRRVMVLSRKDICL